VTSVARAKAILDQYGYVARHGERWRSNPDGSPLVIEFSTMPDQHSRVMDEIFKKSMDTLDIRCVFKVAKWPDQLKAARAGNYMIWWLGLSAGGPDPSDGMMQAYGPSAGGENLSRFKLAAFDALYLQQDRLPDGPERLALLQQMNEILTAYAPMKFISHRFTLDLTYPWVKYYRRWAFTQSEFWRYVDIDQALKDKTLRH
jgi:ABC-type transport system substrate-binding protein